MKEDSQIKVLRPQSNTYSAPMGKCKHFNKTVKLIKENEEHLFIENDMIEYSGKWGIIDQNQKTIIPNTYDYIDFFRNETQYKVALGTLNFQENESTSSYIATGVKWGVINELNEVLIPIEYDWVEELTSDIYALNLGGELTYNDEPQEDYWYANKGIWGVINTRGKLIVPFEYDSYYSTWGKVGRLIYVQKGKPYFDQNSPYDAYDLRGNQILKNCTDKILIQHIK